MQLEVVTKSQNVLTHATDDELASAGDFGDVGFVSISTASTAFVWKSLQRILNGLYLL